MHWWQFSSFSSSSSSSCKHHCEDDSALRKIFPFRRLGFRSRRRRLTRARNVRYLSDSEVGEPPRLWCSPDQLSPRSSAALPQPLPLPDLAMLLRHATVESHNSNSIPVNVPLPSPKEPPCSRYGEERERADAAAVTTPTAIPTFESSFASRGFRRNKEHADTQRSRMTPQELSGIERFQESYGINYGINVPISAPASVFSSPAMSPQRSTRDIYPYHYMTPQAFQVWSSPDMPPLDMNVGLRFSYQMYPEKTALSVDNSPLHSPSVSPCRTRSPSGPPSPLHNKLSIEIPIAPRDSNAQANVHPLPLPPGATTPSQQTSVPQVTAKPDSMPKKSQWQKGKLIGRGTFGSVYVASNRETGALCAMKEVELCPDDPKSAESIKQLEQEIKVLSQLKHPNIVQYYGSEIIGDRFYIYLEYVHPGSINKYVHEHCGAITECVVRSFTRHILSGLAYLHSTKTIHRDIKGANLLVDSNGVVKLADFGMAKHLSGPAANLSLKGSPYWMAPELLQSVMQKDVSSDVALAVDIWSLGCTIIEMLNGKPPWSEYEGAAAMFKVMRESPSIPETLSPEGKDFLRSCFCRNPAERPSASMLLEHRFLKNPQQLDVPTCTQALNAMKLTDIALSPRELPSHKLEQLVVSPVAQTNRVKPANNETRQQSDLTAVPRHSPRSTLDALPSLSPPRLSQSTYHPSPTANMPSPTRESAKKNQYLQ
ncbi:hypothetical protein CsSME_00003769 [Camellia sinensis var. sinensis]|uniref:mitogen-activated protein kinase kinase kinase n=1 Tax=Camellia sinensis var. sinensis TaxID=542762 RepID=A0A4S4EUR6_CAMSN|nr:mitogen-activated protein kinase kinase kinase 5-like [Camellia sinensis]THG20690.1 hypothetical protein TEA_005797 [Camellia sinensis var. sinensis]